MAHSIESRAPFLDYRLVEFLFSLPAEFKLANGMTKRVMRQAMSGVIPDKIRDRIDKMGFVTPEEVWIRQAGPEVFRKLIDKSVKQSQGIFMPETIRIADGAISGIGPLNYPVWRIVSFAAWMEQFNVLIS
jgi:asparagine synthase (glutamine-hydrolysing)